MAYWLVMPAAGSGQRFGSGIPKQYAPLAGRTVIEHSLAPFLSDDGCRGIVVAIASADDRWGSISGNLPRVAAVVGGAERSRSVRNGLAALAERAAADDWVAVHDAARPCLTTVLRDKLLSAATTHTVGALLAVRVADTLKREGDGVVESTIDRSRLWAAQTPQVFRYRDLCQALDSAFAAGRNPTDEAQAIEWTGRRPLLVEGSADNLKITAATQLRLAEAILAGAVACE
jgi:2-C-methyl-D-erythritol 4-phosphate cytidylyltransferase